MNTSLRSLLKLTRFPNLAIIFLTQIMVLFVFLDFREILSKNPVQFSLIVFSTLFISAAGYVINDYFDVKIDQINKPNEVIVGKHISRRQVLLLHQILNLSAIIMGLFAGLKVLIINVLAISVLWFYASIFKKKLWVGNLIVAGLLSLLLLELAWVYALFNPKIWFFAMLVFFTNWIREIIKDMEDQYGDHKYGAKTLPIYYGYTTTKNILIGIMVVSVLCSYLVSYNQWKSQYFIISSGILVFYIYLAFKLKQADRKIHFSSLSTLIKYFLILGLLSSLLLK